MPSRLKRFHTFGHDHFITFSCFERRPFLNNDHTRATILQLLEQLRQHHNFHVYGYVLMPEHVHLVIDEPKQIELANVIRALKTETSKRLKGDREHFWKERYYDFNLFTQPKFTEKLRYIHRNPVKRGLVENPEDWPWSSYRHWLTGERGTVEIESHWTFNQREKQQASNERVPRS